MINFNPALRFLESPNRIVFDSRLNVDENRMAKIVNVERDSDGNAHSRMARESSVFVSEIETVDGGRIKATIVYQQIFDDGHIQINELGSILSADIKENEPDADGIKKMLNVGLTNALIAAVDLSQGKAGALLPGGASYEQLSPIEKQHNGSHLQGWVKATMAVAAIPLLIVAVWAVNKPAKTDQVYLSRFAENPQAIASQVETTKMVLKNMGLDPGKSGDIGCLAQKQ